MENIDVSSKDQLTDCIVSTYFVLLFVISFGPLTNQYNPETGQAHAGGAGDTRSLLSPTGNVIHHAVSYNII